MSYDLTHVRDPEQANQQEQSVQDIKGRGVQKESNCITHRAFEMMKTHETAPIFTLQPGFISVTVPGYSLSFQGSQGRTSAASHIIASHEPGETNGSHVAGSHLAFLGLTQLRTPCPENRAAQGTGSSHIED